MRMVLRNLGLQDRFHMITTYVSRTPFETRLAVWIYWHRVSQESTMSTQLARLRVAQRHPCQKELEFSTTVQIVKKRNREFYQSIWKTYTIPIVLLYRKYLEESPLNRMSMGLFLNLRPFYCRNVSLKDMEMCCCKVHLHGRWTVVGLVKLAAKLEISLPFADYTSFFQVKIAIIFESYV